MAAEPVTLLGRAVGEDGELLRRLVEARELERGIDTRALVGLGGEGGRVAALEIRPDRGPALGIGDAHEAPGLGQTDRGREAGERDQPFERALRHRRRAERAHVAAPGDQVGEPGPETVVEDRPVGGHLGG